MNCNNCGNILNEGDKFCNNCGTAIEKVGESTIPEPVKVSMTNTVTPKKKSHVGLIIGIILISLTLLGVGIFVIVKTIIGSTRGLDKYVCTSDIGNITLYYNNETIVGYKATGSLSYNLEEQKQLVPIKGVENYLLEFNNWFMTNTGGVCTKNGEISNSKKEEIVEEKEIKTDVNVKTVGDEDYGYIDIPNKWTTFIDVDGNTALQYSYANVYIATLDYVEGTYDAKESAASHEKLESNNADVTEVNSKVVTIGKNKKYTAYQVSSYYKSEDLRLITYWFNTDDGVLRYIAIEGPDELDEMKLSDFYSIPDSFSITK